MRQPLVIVGCGGFGREVWAILQACRDSGDEWLLEGFIDDHPSEQSLSKLEILGSTWLGSVTDLARRDVPYAAILAVGAPAVRHSVWDRLRDTPVNYPQVVHPDSTIGWPTHLGEGVIIAPGVRISTNVVLEEHVHVDQNATIGHDSSIGAFSRLNPQACISGSVSVGRRTLVGASATVLQGVSIGDEATVGAAACVVQDVQAGMVVKGVPAR